MPCINSLYLFITFSEHFVQYEKIYISVNTDHQDHKKNTDHQDHKKNTGRSQSRDITGRDITGQSRSVENTRDIIDQSHSVGIPREPREANRLTD